jgi:hypothetical protein
LRESRVHYHWQQNSLPFRTGVSLHSHTLHSRESLDFIERATANTPWLSGAIRKQRAKYREVKGRDLDLRRAWWTPPLSPRQAFDLEKTQIERVLAMDALVSITDHDNIEAGINLHVLEETRDCPLSIEWTIPFRRTFFHAGVHNLPADAAIEMTQAMNEFTATPSEPPIGPMLEWLGAAPDSLIVLNHPAWDENHIGEAAHSECAGEFLQAFRPFIHALELNGLRPWSENRKAVQLAARFGLPLISGGDRHGREPNACVNLTNASSFAEFAAEVRCDGWSDVLLLPQYREPLKMRILENMCDILEDDPNHALGWMRWSDRVFYLTDEGIDKSLSEFFGGKFPAVMNRFVSLMQLAKHRRVRSALRLAFNDRREFAV